MISVNDIRNGMTLVVDGNIVQVLEFLHVKPGKGAAFVRVKFKNLRTGATLEESFNTNVKFERANISKFPVQYLYCAGDTYCFMKMDTYEQIELTSAQIGDNKNYLIENMEVNFVQVDGEMLGLNLPDKVELTVTETTPATKSASTNATKDAVLETGLQIRVPLFIEQGEKILVTTADGKYSSRA